MKIPSKKTVKALQNACEDVNDVNDAKIANALIYQCVRQMRYHCAKKGKLLPYKYSKHIEEGGNFIPYVKYAFKEEQPTHFQLTLGNDEKNVIKAYKALEGIRRNYPDAAEELLNTIAAEQPDPLVNVDPSSGAKVKLITDSLSRMVKDNSRKREETENLKQALGSIQKLDSFDQESLLDLSVLKKNSKDKAVQTDKGEVEEAQTNLDSYAEKNQ